MKAHCCLLSLVVVLSGAGRSCGEADSSTSESLPSKSDFRVNGLDEVEPAFAEYAGEMYAGRLPMNNGQRHGELMFWLFAPLEPAAKNTITVWLNGGPGCSSFYAGIFLEHGPVTIPPHRAGFCCVSEREPLIHNPYSWAYATHILYVEQPVGVGFSEGGPEPTNETQIAADFYAFLQNLYHVFPEYQEYQLFISGESYAGMYIPPIAHKIFKENQNDKGDDTTDVPIPLGGIAIGNGVLDARIQGSKRIDFAYWHGQIDMYTRDVLHDAWDACMSDTKKVTSPYHSFDPPDDCGMLTAIPIAAGKGVSTILPSGPNIYDVTTWDPYAVLKGNDTTVKFLNDPRVQKKLHAPDMVWRGCMPGAGRRRRRRRRLGEDFEEEEEGYPHEYSHRDLFADFLLNDKPVSMNKYVADLLDGGIRTMMYAGDRDMACNAASVEAVLNNMTWSGSKHWYKAPRGVWLTNETGQLEPAGYVKQHKNLQFVVVYNSGHLVPYNQPAKGLDLITRFLRNEPMSHYPIDISSLELAGAKSKRKKDTEVQEAPGMSEDLEKEAHHFKRPTMDALWPILFAFLVGVGVSYFYQKRGNGGYQSIPAS